MIDESAVIKELQALSGLSPSEAAMQKKTCHFCCIDVFERLKKPEYETDERIINLSAALSFYTVMLRTSSQDDNITSVKSGDVTVTKDNLSSVLKAERLKNEAEKIAACLLTDNNFLFAGI